MENVYSVTANDRTATTQPNTGKNEKNASRSTSRHTQTHTRVCTERKKKMYYNLTIRSSWHTKWYVFVNFRNSLLRFVVPPATHIHIHVLPLLQILSCPLTAPFAVMHAHGGVSAVSIHVDATHPTILGASSFHLFA